MNGGRSISYNKKEGIYIYVCVCKSRLGPRAGEGTHLMFARINKKRGREKEGESRLSWFLPRP